MIPPQSEAGSDRFSDERVCYPGRPGGMGPGTDSTTIVLACALPIQGITVGLRNHVDGNEGRTNSFRRPVTSGTMGMREGLSSLILMPQDTYAPRNLRMRGEQFVRQSRVTSGTMGMREGLSAPHSHRHGCGNLLYKAPTLQTPRRESSARTSCEPRP